MEDKEIEKVNSETTTDTAVEEQEQPEEQETVESLREKNKQLFERAKKAETALKVKPEPKTESKVEVKTDTLSEEDMLAVVEAKVPAVDLPEVKRIAKILGVPVVQALSNKITKDFLSSKAEERRTAEATTTKAPRTQTKASPEDILARASRNEEVKDIEALVEARMSLKKKKQA